MTPRGSAAGYLLAEILDIGAVWITYRWRAVRHEADKMVMLYQPCMAGHSLLKNPSKDKAVPDVKSGWAHLDTAAACLFTSSLLPFVCLCICILWPP